MVAAAAAAAAVVVVVIGVCSPLVYGVWPAFIYWRGGGWCLFAFGFIVVGWWWRLLACGVRLTFVDWHGGGWHLFAFGLGVVGWWSAFSRLRCEVSVCSLAWWWLAFVRLWFWRGWLAVAFARLWGPRVCSLGRWLASVCFGPVATAGLVVDMLLWRNLRASAGEAR